MSTVVRTWLAGTLLLFSALLLSSTADPQLLGPRAMVALVVLFGHCWVIAVGERACPVRGGTDIPRFSLGPRLLSVRPGLLSQCLVPAMMIGVATRNTTVLGIGVAAVLVLTTDVLRASMIYVIPVVAVISALLTMKEFHTLGDLLTSAQTWLSAGLTIAIWTLVLSGPLLRSDAAAVKPKGQLVTLLAGLPSYAFGFWLLTHTGLAGLQPDLLGLAMVLLAGGVLQTVVLGFLARPAEIKNRTAGEFPRVNAVSVGMALMPLMLPVVGLLGMLLVGTGTHALGQLAPRPVWVGLAALVLLVPLVPAAALVAASIDRIDGRRGSRRNRQIALGVLGGWLLGGPVILSALYAPGGPLAGLASVFTPVGGSQPIIAGSGGTSFLFGAAFGGDLLLFGLPAADLCRAVTLMAGTCGLLSAGMMRHASCGLKGPHWGTVFITLGLSALGIALVQPRLGPAGAALAVAAAACIMALVDARSGEEVDDKDAVVCEFGFEADALAAEAAGPTSDASDEFASDEEVPEATEAIGLSLDDDSDELAPEPPEPVPARAQAPPPQRVADASPAAAETTTIASAAGLGGDVDLYDITPEQVFGSDAFPQAPAASPVVSGGAPAQGLSGLDPEGFDFPIDDLPDDPAFGRQPGPRNEPDGAAPVRR